MQPNFFDSPLPYQRTSPTSKSGADVALPKAGTQTANILKLIELCGPISDQRLVTLSGYAINVVTARRNRLLNDGWIVLAGSEVGPSGAHRQTWKIKT